MLIRLLLSFVLLLSGVPVSDGRHTTDYHSRDAAFLDEAGL